MAFFHQLSGNHKNDGGGWAGLEHIATHHAAMRIWSELNVDGLRLERVWGGAAHGPHFVERRPGDPGHLRGDASGKEGLREGRAV